MPTTPKWYLPVAVAALIWNLLGCVAYLSGVSVKPEDIAKLSDVEQAIYAARTWWAVSGTAIGVWGGAAGSLGLILHKRWAMPLLIASLIGLIFQDVGLFVLSGVGSRVGAGVMALQGLVLVIALALVLLGSKAREQGWIA
jgi:hypothetical protein